VTTFALVHGAWHDASCWDLLRPELADRGHATVAPDLPAGDPRTTFPDYAAVVVAALEAADAGSDVVVVGHSLASDTIPHVAAARPVRLLVYLCPNMGRSFARPAGGPRAFRPDFPEPPLAPDGGSTWVPAVAERVLYRRLPAPVAHAALGHLRTQHFPPPVQPPLTLPRTPAAYVYTPDDEIFSAERSRWMAREALGLEPIELPGGHFPMLERPAELADLLDRLARAAPPPAAARG
jgi:pimeloyl-ACP methyl ester carboxylesterase